MGFSNLRSFLEELRRRHDLTVVESPVSSRLELAEIHRRVIAAGGPALLFTRVDDGAFPVVTNLFGTAERADLAFGDRAEGLIRKVVDQVRGSMPPGPTDLWRSRDLLAAALRTGVRSVRKGPILDVVEREPNLAKLPALTSWPEDGGPFITLPLVYTEDPETGASNLGMYRLQIHDRRMTGIHWQIGKGGGFHYHTAETAGNPLPVTVFLGGPPALTLAAIAPLPENVPELMLASVLAGHRLRRCPGPGAHALIAEAEFALVGRVPPRIRRPEGPFGDHYGYYSLEHPYPVFEVAAIARRKNAIFPATVVGKPRQEDFFIGDRLQELLSPLFPLLMPGVHSLWSYGETGYHGLGAAVVRERYRHESMASAFRILGEGQLSLTKFLFLTDRPVDLRDFKATLECILERTHVETDLFVIAELSMDTLDYSGPRVNEGSKGVWRGIGDPVRELPREFNSSNLPSGISEVRVFCGGCVAVSGPGHEDDPELGVRISHHPAFDNWPLVVVVDDAARATATVTSFLWTVFTRFEPAGDLHARHTVDRHHLVYRMPIVIDARMKKPYPKELFCDPETAKRVTGRWKEYFPQGGIEMGDSDRADLDR